MSRNRFAEWLRIPARESTGAAKSPGFVSINFDDGYRSAYQNAVPILDRAGLKSTQFIITGLLGAPGYIAKDQLLAMHAHGHEIGAHTRTHERLSRMKAEEQYEEIVGSYQDLVEFGIQPRFFAYPYGDYDQTSISIVRTKFSGATRPYRHGANDENTDPFLLNCLVMGPEGVSIIRDITRRIDKAQANGRG